MNKKEVKKPSMQQHQVQNYVTADNVVTKQEDNDFDTSGFASETTEQEVGLISNKKSSIKYLIAICCCSVGVVGSRINSFIADLLEQNYLFVSKYSADMVFVVYMN